MLIIAYQVPNRLRSLHLLPPPPKCPKRPTSPPNETRPRLSWNLRQVCCLLAATHARTLPHTSRATTRQLCRPLVSLLGWVRIRGKVFWGSKQITHTLQRITSFLQLSDPLLSSLPRATICLPAHPTELALRQLSSMALLTEALDLSTTAPRTCMARAQATAAWCSSADLVPTPRLPPLLTLAASCLLPARPFRTDASSTTMLRWLLTATLLKCLMAPSLSLEPP